MHNALIAQAQCSARMLLACLLLLPLLAGSAFAAAPDNAPKAVAEQDGRMVLLLVGDSLSAGYGLSLEQSWPALLQRSFDDAAIPLRIVNISISGETSGGGLARLPAALDRWQPEFVLVALGANDGLRGKSLKQLERNLEAMALAAKKSGATPLLAGMHIPPNFGPRYANAFHALYGELAKKHDIALLPFLLEEVATKPAMMQSDGLHPNANAQPLIRDHVLQFLLPLLDDDSQRLSAAN